MIEFVLVIIAFYSVLGIILYGLILLLTVSIQKILHKKLDNFGKTYRKIRIVILFCCIAGIIFTFLHLSINPARNYKTAYIEKSGSGFVITLKGKRNLMVHDLVSLILKKTYTDSIKIAIPRSDGAIDGLEIPDKPGSYRIMKGTAISISGNKLQVRLYYNNYDEKKIDTSFWNADYELEWRK